MQKKTLLPLQWPACWAATPTALTTPMQDQTHRRAVVRWAYAMATQDLNLCAQAPAVAPATKNPSSPA